MFHYKVYNIEISSEVEMPSACISDGSSEPQIIIRAEKMDEILKKCIEMKALEEDDREESRQELDLTRKDDEIIYLPGFALFRVLNGKEIIYHELEKTDQYQVEQWLLNRCITAALAQRGQVIIHCSALKKDGKMFIISGDSGSGKSTMADRFLQEGNYTFASDDTVRVEIENGELLGYGAYPLRRLCLDAAKRSGYDLNSIIRIDDGDKEKYGVPMKDVFTAEGQKVSALFVLKPDEAADSVKIEEITGSDKLNMLTECVYNYKYYQRTGLKPEILLKMIAIADKLGIYVISRPVKGMTVNEVAEKINEILIKIQKKL